MASLHGKVVALTGAGGGLGRATALACAQAGARLALTDADETALAATCADVAAAGGNAVAVAGDVGDPATHRALVARALDAFGALDGLANIAGVLGPGTLAEATPRQFDRVMHANCLGQLLAIQAAQDALVASRGAIVNVASIGALVGLPMMAVYCASKAAVLGLTRAVALELAPHVRCNALCPGGIDTPMARGLLAQVPADQRDHLLRQLTGRQLLPRFAQPAEIASTLVFLLSGDAAFMTGAVVAADGGHSAA